ncbi:flagellar protein [Vibrio azureus]|uniref:Flagellar protein FliL n=1 Tax=Vibrio azureus NBRC 104587 TaxID=1219077 RepID=U3AQJ3_9VIBR|nr:flagellar basal body-associated FliL family protein [Vibrio azureus]AUI88576.1 flagellar protein [Vibrio azureus]GAD76030.1 flagellar biosynthesis protein FliL [Vibrio azureus NBRC 104587]
MTKKQMILLFISMIITITLVSVAAVTGSIWYLTQKEDPFTIEEGTDRFSHFFNKEEPASKEPRFHTLDKVVVSIKGEKRSHFVMLELAIETRRPEQIKNIDHYLPVVQNSMIKLFSQKNLDELQQAGAIDSLQKEIKQTLLDTFAKNDLVRNIDDVLVTKFVVQ